MFAFSNGSRTYRPASCAAVAIKPRMARLQERDAMGKRRKPRSSRQVLSREQLSLSREVDYIIGRAQNHEARLVTLGALILFSTETGDAWLLDPEDNLALCLARAGDPQPFTITETATTFGVEWNANYQIEGAVFIAAERSGQVKSILGYPTREILQAMRRGR